MKKRLVLLIVAALVLLSALPALAVSPADLNALARYFPASTPMFISVRIDDDFIATLNTLAESVAARFPEANMDQTLQQALDEAVQEILPDGTFQADVRPWLGDTASIGVLSFAAAFDSTTTNDDEVPVLVAISVKDSAAALDFFINALNRSDTPFAQTTGDGYTLIVPDETEVPASLDGVEFVIVRDDVLLISANTDSGLVGPSGLQSPNLAEKPEFASTLALLPFSDYNATVFNDTAADILQASAAMDPATASMLQAMSQVGVNFDAIGPQAMGFTILDGSTFVMDVAQPYDPAAMPSMAVIPDPVDPAFAARVPAGMPLVIHGTGLKTQLEAAGSSIDEMLAAMLSAMPENGDANDIAAARADFDKQIAQANNLFTSFTGLSFTDDVLSWMDGDYLLFLGTNPDLDSSSMAGFMTTFPLELGIAFETTDAAKTQEAVAGLTRGLRQVAAMAARDSGDSGPSITITDEQVVGVSATVLTISASPDIPWTIELLMGANNSVFALGTRGAVSAIFAADGGLPTNAAFQRAQTYMLPNTTAVAWLYPAGLLPLANLAGAFAGGPSGEQQAQAIRDVLGFIDSGTITSAYDVDAGIALARATLTLNLE